MDIITIEGIAGTILGTIMIVLDLTQTKTHPSDIDFKGVLALFGIILLVIGIALILR